ncbi:hypothetical protein A5791_24945 [Mycobacterium sp. 852002-51163_SCH5372311]|nr:hypothetical protein A5791_24945 [Mycobacterium sp. 852002-51163_SCH5372311]
MLTAPGGPIELAEFPLTTPAPGTAVLKLRMAGICGSDLHIFRGELPLPCPFAMGHEMVCEIAELGEGLTNDATGTPLAVGDRVVTLMPEPFHLAEVNDAFAAADAGLVPRGALVP